MSDEKQETKEPQEQHPKGKSGVRGGRALEGVNLVLYSAIFIAILILVNWFVNQHDHRWDLTPNKQFSLSPQSVKLVKSLKRPVHIYYFGQKQEFGPANDLLQSYRVTSNEIRVQYVDPVRQPRLAREFGVNMDGTIVVRAGKRHYKAQTANEQGVTDALIRILNGKRTACFIQGHGERSLSANGRSGYSEVKAALGDESYSATELMLNQKQIPSDCSMIVAAGPKTDYLPAQIDVVQKYVENGGRAMFLLDPGMDLPNLTKMLAAWGVTAQNDLVIDLNPMAQIFGTQPYMPLIVSYGSSSIVEPLHAHGSVIATLLPLTRSFDIAENAPSGVTTDSLCKTSGDSFGISNWTPSMQQISLRPGQNDPKGPLTVAVSGKITPQSGSAKDAGRFVAVGSSEWADNAFFHDQGNPDLFMNIINWLAAQSNLISIGPKPHEKQHLNITERQMGQFLYFGVIGLPLAVILIGAGVWWQRR